MYAFWSICPMWHFSSFQSLPGQTLCCLHGFYFAFPLLFLTFCFQSFPLPLVHPYGVLPMLVQKSLSVSLIISLHFHVIWIKNGKAINTHKWRNSPMIKHINVMRTLNLKVALNYKSKKVQILYLCKALWVILKKHSLQHIQENHTHAKCSHNHERHKNYLWETRNIIYLITKKLSKEGWYAIQSKNRQRLKETFFQRNMANKHMKRCSHR